MNTSHSHILFICGGKWQLPWMQYLKNKGHRIVLVDPNEYPPCAAIANMHIKCDARDVEGIYTEVQNRGLKIDFVTSEQTDVSTQTVAALSAKLGTRSNTMEAVERFANKAVNRAFVAEIDASRMPAFRKVYNVEDAMQFLRDFPGDAMLKPTDAQSSRGISRIAADCDEATLNKAIGEAFAQTPQDYVLIEQFITGSEITVEGLMTPKGHYTLAISAKKHFRTGIASDLQYPAPLDPSLEEALIAFHNNLIAKTGLQFGVTHAEYMINPQGFFLVEMACRGGGTLIPSDIVPHVSGVPVYDVLYALQTENTVSVNPLTASRHALLHFFEFPAGQVQTIHGLEEALNLPGVHALELEFASGDVLKPAGDDRGRQGYTILLTETANQLNETLHKVM
ncbi:MAG: ATP-grasp domain-containing protein, partial [Sphingomonadales bacterium]